MGKVGPLDLSYGWILENIAHLRSSNGIPELSALAFLTDV